MTSSIVQGEAAGGPLLDEGTKLVGVRVRPTCGEALAFVRAAPRAPEVLTDEHSPPDEATQEENRLRSDRRRRSQARRYCAGNMIVRMVTVTYAPDPETGYRCEEREEAMRDVAAFLRRLRAHLGYSFAALWVPELHKDGRNWHVHIGLQPWVEKQELTRLWGHGIVDVRLMRDKSGRPSGRACSGYVSKYVSKELEGGEAGRHAYEVTQGFQPEVITVAADSLEEAQGIAASFFGGEVPASAWSSSSDQQWKGPAMRWWGWSEW